MTAITFTLDDAQFKRALAALRATVDDPAPVMRGIGSDLQNEIRRCLRDSRTPWGEPC